MKKSMIMVSFVLAALQAWPAMAAEREPYAVTVDAVRKGDNVTVSIKITEFATGGKANVLSTPRITIRQGQRGELAVGKQADSSEEMESGFRFEVISVKGKDEVLVVVTVIEKKDVVWAEASKTKVVQETPTD